ncbi:piRNA biogenesis protein EXD1 isoform X3 [Chiloscyllium punctatum]|uniref:piRNA biogenesis protein EXD1 isoform X3 n=1 Tax=Chiloscyllium punctatum TaxID=137246 RepID=UPI003B636190
MEILDGLPTRSMNKSANNNDSRDKLEDTTIGNDFGEQRFSELEDESLKYIVIDQFHQKFGPAIFHIKKQSAIGVAVEGIDICRFGKLCLIQIATVNQIYLFDIFLLGPVAFKNGLKMILEDSDILKVIHDCRLVSDCLYHQYRVDLTNVFDTQVADVLQFSLETGGLLPSCVSTLEECLVRHLSLPTTKALFLQYSACAVKENPKVWTCRPLPIGLMQRAGLEVMYLLSLRSVLMDKLMMDFTTQVDNYLSMYRNMPCINLGSAEFDNGVPRKRRVNWNSCQAVWKTIWMRLILVSKQPRSLPHYSMELPYELKELAVIQRLRRGDAMKSYKIDENGLLVRPHPQFEKTPEAEGRILNTDDIPELESIEPSRENVLEMQNDEIPLLEPRPDCTEDLCPPLERISLSVF